MVLTGRKLPLHPSLGQLDIAGFQVPAPSNLDLIIRLPGVFALMVSALTLIGGTAGAAIGYVASRRINVKSQTAHERLVKTLEDHNRVITNERNEYRENLHSERNKAQTLQLELQEAAARPDLTKLFESQTLEATRRYEIYTQQTALIARQSEVLATVSTNQEKMVADMSDLTRFLQRLLNGPSRAKKAITH